MDMKILADMIPTFEQTVFIPIAVYAIINEFIHAYSTYVHGPLVDIDPDLRTLRELHDSLHVVTNYVIRNSERTLTITGEDPLLSVWDMMVRYDNLRALHEQIEDIHEISTRVTNLIETGQVTVDTPNLYYSVVRDNERLRLAGNVLVTTMRHLEWALQNHEDGFFYLAKQWFED